MRRAASPGCSILPAERLARYFAARWGEPVAISGLKRFHGGSARETFRFDATGASGRREALVLRRDPPSSLIETDRAVEFRALKAVHGGPVRVPEPLFCETGGEAFGSPGFIMREIAGGRAASLLEPEPYGADAGAIGTAFFAALGDLHRRDPADFELAAIAPGDAARRRLDHWRAAYLADRSRPEPVVDAAFRWLDRTPVAPPRRVSVVHGDYRSGNFLFDGPRLLAILDWEMVHAGDPLEDLAWAMDPLWAHGSGRAGAMLAEADAVRVWEAASGLAAEPAALAWWRVFAQVQGVVIWISSAREVIDGRSIDPVLGFAGFVPYRFHVATLARTLGGRA